MCVFGSSCEWILPLPSPDPQFLRASGTIDALLTRVWHRHVAWHKRRETGKGDPTHVALAGSVSRVMGRLHPHPPTGPHSTLGPVRLHVRAACMRRISLRPQRFCAQKTQVDIAA